MTVLLVIVYVIVCIFLILVVLLQQGKGADLAGAFGGGGSQTSFGPRGGSNLMHRMTVSSFVAFVVLSMALAVISGKARTSVMEDVDAAAPTAVTEPVIDTAAESNPVEALTKEEGSVEVETSEPVSAPEPAVDPEKNPAATE